MGHRGQPSGLRKHAYEKAPALTVVLLGLLAPSVAHAAPTTVDDAGTSNVDALMSDLTRQADSLSMTDCTLSCKALASMERARDRICELSPGPRCEEARAKVTAAREKVASACPACGPSKNPEPAPPPADAKASAPPSRKGDAQPTSQQALESEPGKGGCASCRVATTTRGERAGDIALLMLAAFGIRRITRRKRRD